MAELTLTNDEAATLVTCEGCRVHLPMAAAMPDAEDNIYLCARCLDTMLKAWPTATERERDEARAALAERAAQVLAGEETAALHARVRELEEALEEARVNHLRHDANCNVNMDEDEDEPCDCGFDAICDKLDRALAGQQAPTPTTMKKIERNMAAQESRAFWETAERTASEVSSWPDWRRAGINVAQLREPQGAVDGIEPTPDPRDALLAEARDLLSQVDGCTGCDVRGLVVRIDAVLAKKGGG